MLELTLQSSRSPDRDFVKALVAVFVAHTILYGLLLLKSGGVPYVMDGNETYCTWWHAYSLVEFPIGKSCGLANEALSYDVSAQSVVHTHQGNWPRIPAAVLYMLGFKSIESQVALTTFLVGGTVAMLIFACFTSIVSLKFGLLATGVFLTDYVLFAQWQLNTYRVWQHFFLFGILYSVIRICDATVKPRWWLSLFAVSLALFYCELTFAVFVTVTSMMWILLHAQRRWRVMCNAMIIMGAAAIAAFSVLILQLVLYYGFDGLQRDIQVTFFGRNFAADPAAFAETIKELNDEHMVASFYTVSDGRLNLNISTILNWLIRYGIGIYSPSFGLGLLFVVWGAVLIRLLKLRPVTSLMQRVKNLVSISWVHWTFLLTGAVGIMTAPPFALDSSIRAAGILSSEMSATLYIGWITFCMVIGVFWSTKNNILKKWIRIFIHKESKYVAYDQTQPAIVLTSLAPSRWSAWITTSIIYCLGCWLLSLCFVTGKASDPQMMPLWRFMWSFAGILPDGTWCDKAGTIFLILLFLTGWRLVTMPVLASTIHDTPKSTLGNEGAGSGIARYFLAISVGLAAAIMFSPGYVFPGYIERYCVLLAYFVLPLVAYAFWILAREWSNLTFVRRHTGVGQSSSGFFLNTGSVVARTGTVFALIFWLVCQAALMKQLPLDYIRPVKDVIKKYVGSNGTIVIDDHGTALINFGVKWAYRDPSMAFLPYLLERNQDRLIVLRSSNRGRFVWFADASNNRDYDEPMYFLHFRVRSLETASAVLAGNTAVKASELPIVKDAMGPGFTGARVVASDPSGRDEWVLLQLDWVKVMPDRSS